MIPCVIGMDAIAAQAELEASGFSVQRVEYVSRRGIPDADASRVIRQRMIGNNSMEITVSHFKTQAG